MSKEPTHPFEEPYGQRGVGHLARPTLLLCCGIGLVVSVFMSGRSATTYDQLFRHLDDRRIEFGSALDRFIFTIAPMRENDGPRSGWSFSSMPTDSENDGWRPSWKKTLGIEWGSETFGWRWQTQTHWRLRIKWRTIAIVCLIPLAAEILRQRRLAVDEARRTSHQAASTEHQP